MNYDAIIVMGYREVDIIDTCSKATALELQVIQPIPKAIKGYHSLLIYSDKNISLDEFFHWLHSNKSGILEWAEINYKENHPPVEVLASTWNKN